MPLSRFFILLVVLGLASGGLAQSSAAPGRALDDFSNYPLDEMLAGKGERGAWRTRGVNPALSGRIVSVEGDHVLGLQARQYVIYDSPSTFSLPADSSGTLSFRLRLPLPGEIKHDQAFYFIIKTREQAENDLTNPVNGLLLLQFAFVDTDRAYRLRLEGPGPSPTASIIAPGKWHEVAVRIDLAQAVYQIEVTAPGGVPSLVTNHLYSDGLVPFKNRGNGAAELIYLRNHNLAGQVEIDALRFSPAAATAATR